MSQSGWLLFIGGSLFTIVAMALFLYAMWLGLNRQRWWPMGIVATAWVLAMAAYSLWDGKERQATQRQRVDTLSLLQTEKSEGRRYRAGVPSKPSR